ncbi:gamma-glutamyltransferase [Acuticoccus mangrovi]|uniref:Glutathione hydrolase proenzyme n=1 Tax=Acuticoccus mangrovi TaxID=2796142 RepID=A0A934MGQ3_9HYPH|nr:gamma-glutamyltransferase [Acuticoccus mangrovi]MBJ3776155.1 gamma-glutamyltransferase [Acuticoccus mangrovi]
MTAPWSFFAVSAWRGVARSAAIALALIASGSAAEAQIIANGQRFVPVMAEHQMVVTQEAQASEVGLDILRHGGNAVDAAVAVGFALAVTLPRAGNIGGGGFMVIHTAEGENVAVDYREMAPRAATRDMFLDASGEASPELSRRSGLAVGVPGTVAGLALAHERYGSGKLSLADLVAPAVALARDGFTVSPAMAAALATPYFRDRLLADAAAAALFYPGGEPPAAGSTLALPTLADTLEAIGEAGPAAFYEGPVAEAIVAAVAAKGGRMTLDDLATYEAVVREPVRGTFKDYEVVSMPPPSSGGVHLVQLLNILEPSPFGTWGLNSANMIHMMVEAEKYAYADRAVYLGDPDFVDVPIAALTSKDYAATIRDRIDMDRATPSSEIAADPGTLPYESNETTHFSIVDAAGNAVSNTYTLNFSYGVGFAAAGAGFLLNNELDDFSAKPGVPNAYGLVGGAANAVEPRKRPLSSMTPTILLKDGKPALVTGSPGGSRIITTVLQVILNATVHERDIATATAAPRVHHQWLPDYIRIEEGISHDTIRLLEEKGHDVRIQDAMGAAQSIAVGPDGVLTGASDPRRPGGLAVGD